MRRTLVVVACGNYRWVRGLETDTGGVGIEDVAGRVVDGVATEGHHYVSGRFRGNVESGAGLVRSRGSWDGFLLYHTGDAPQWVVPLGGADSDTARRVVVDGDDNAYLGGAVGSGGDLGAGETYAFTSGFVATYDTSGAHRWSTTTSAVGDYGWNDVALQSSGDVLVAGEQTLFGEKTAWITLALP